MTNYCTWCHQADEPSSLPGQPTEQGIAKSPTCPRCHRTITLIIYPQSMRPRMQKQEDYVSVDR